MKSCGIPGGSRWHDRWQREDINLRQCEKTSKKKLAKKIRTSNHEGFLGLNKRFYKMILKKKKYIGCREFGLEN